MKPPSNLSIVLHLFVQIEIGGDGRVYIQDERKTRNQNK